MANASFTDVFKTFYPKMGEDAVYKKNPLMAMIEHDTAAAPTFVIPVVVSNTNKVGSAYASIFSGSSGDFFTAKFTGAQYSLYGETDFSGADLRNFKAGSVSENFFKNYVIGKLNILLEAVMSNAARGVYSNGKLTLGRVGAGTASPITMASRAQTAFISKGMQLRFGASADATSLRAGVALVTKVDKNTGIVTYTGTITSLAVADYCFDYLSVEAGTIPGLEGWNPATASSSFLGVDQTVDSLQLGGYAYDATVQGTSIDTCISAAIAEHEALNGNKKVDFAMINPFDKDKLSRALGGKIRYDSLSVKPGGKGGRAETSFDTIEVYGTPLIADSNCPQGVIKGLTYGNATWGTNMPIPSRQLVDGIEWFPFQDGTDSYRGRSAAEHLFYVRNPKDLLRIALPTS